jgi:hypothetical protein
MREASSAELPSSVLAAGYEKSIQSAAQWLAKAQSNTNEDRAYRLLGLAWAGRDKDAIRKATLELLETQHSDGGSCLSILRLLRGEGSLVFPLIPDGGDPRALIPPSFALGIATSRNERLPHVRNGALRVLVNDALIEHIQGNARSIAFSYVALRNKIRHLVDQAIPDTPVAVRDEWTARTFRIDDALESWRLQLAHWRAVLSEAMLLTRASNSISAPLVAAPQHYSDDDGGQDDLT